MGATKRWAELIVRSFAFRTESQPRNFCSVRFGNVIGSQGSVVPLFKEQIELGGPVTLTDENMSRFFMATNEAVELIIQAAALSHGGEIFLLDMGEPVRIRDIAETMIRLAGLSVKDAHNPEGDIAIEITGIRPGEKIVEELLYDPSAAERTSHPKISYGQMRHYPNDDMREAVEQLAALARDGAETEAVKLLFDFIAQNSGGRSL
jgi:FlaA1/EpsC-like NDP-sugar epimerase